MGIRLPKKVEMSETLKSLMYWNAFMLNDMIVNDEDDIEIALLTMIGTGGFGYDCKVSKSGGQN